MSLLLRPFSDTTTGNFPTTLAGALHKIQLVFLTTSWSHKVAPAQRKAVGNNGIPKAIG